MFKINGQLLEVAPIGDYQGTKYSSIIVRSEAVANGQLIRYKIDLSKVEHESLFDMLDSEVEIGVDLIKGQNSQATVKVVAVRA